MRSSGPAPRRLVEDGAVRFGTFRSHLAEVNLLDAAIAPGWPLPRWLKALRLKQFEAAQIVSERCFIGLALFDTRLLGLVQVKLFDRERAERSLFERKVAPSSLVVPNGVVDSTGRYEGPGARLLFRNELGRDRLTVSFRIDEPGALPLSGELEASADGAEPLVVSIPFGPNRGMYSTKAHLRVAGTVRAGERRFELDPATSWLLLDDHKGYYPYEMQWDWVAGAGIDRQGRRVSSNLTRNQSIDPAAFNENAVWVDGRLTLLPPITIARPAPAPSPPEAETWRIRDEHGEVDLELDVASDHRVDVNALVLRSRYRGPVGTFRGRIAPDGQEPIAVDGLFGMGEQFYLRG